MANPGEQVTDVALTEDRLIVDLADGRSISVPLAWFPRLLHATSQERKNWEIAGAGYGIHWPDLDEDLSVEGLLRGAPASKAKALVSSHRHAPEPPPQAYLLRRERFAAR
jgi:hypothetical protein